jgi:hypothetical protein
VTRMCWQLSQRFSRQLPPSLGGLIGVLCPVTSLTARIAAHRTVAATTLEPFPAPGAGPPPPRARGHGCCDRRWKICCRHEPERDLQSVPVAAKLAPDARGGVAQHGHAQVQVGLLRTQRAVRQASETRHAERALTARITARLTAKSINRSVWRHHHLDDIPPALACGSCRTRLSGAGVSPA